MRAVVRAGNDRFCITLAQAERVRHIANPRHTLTNGLE